MLRRQRSGEYRRKSNFSSNFAWWSPYNSASSPTSLLASQRKTQFILKIKFSSSENNTISLKSIKFSNYIHRNRWKAENETPNKKFFFEARGWDWPSHCRTTAKFELLSYLKYNNLRKFQKVLNFLEYF